MLGRNWKLVYDYIWDLVEAGRVHLAAVDSCKPGLVYWGSEGGFRWCDVNPRWGSLYSRDPWRLEVLARALEGDLKEAWARFGLIASYVEVKAYRLALRMASRASGVEVLDLGPPMPTPLSVSSRANRARLRRALIELTGAPASYEPPPPRLGRPLGLR